ncbi:T9SS type A sorting domain-containing protein [bacterium]|nr:T9SS type A sorting domain-containing protein [bacterium]
MKHSYKLSTLVLAGLLLMMVPFTLSAQGENMSFLGNWGEGGGEMRAVANFGDLVYYGIGNQFVITSFEDPANPFTAATLTLDDMVEDIVWKVSGGVTYVLVSGSTLNIIDVTNPLAPALISTTELTGYGEGLGVSGDYVYIGAGSAGMQIIDISDPANPSSVATLAGASPGAYAEGINVSSPYAYLGNGGGTDIFDISDPTNAFLVGTMVNDGWIQDAMPISNYLYACDWSNGIDIIDISNPASPVHVSTLSNPVNADITFDGNFGYIASREYGVTVIDVTDPAAPTVLGTFDTEGVVRKISFGSINIDGNQEGHLFAAEVSMLSAVNVSDPTDMSISGSVAVPAPADGLCYSATLDGDIAYLAYRYSVRAIDITNPSVMSELGNFSVSDTGMVKKVVVKDDIVFAGSRFGGLRALDFSDPTNPTQLSAVITDRTNDVAISGNYVYAATNNNGIGIVNVSTASSPTLVGYVAESMVSGRYGEGVAAYGNVMVQSTWGALYFYDISSPESPTLQDTVALTTGTSWLTLDDDYAYVHDFDSLKIFDLSNLSAVVQVGGVNTGGSWDGDAFREGDYVYVNAETAGIKVYDVTDITNPTEVASYDMLNSARGITVRDGFVYSSEKEGGFSIYTNNLGVSIDSDGSRPNSFSLSQNYPNPFNPSTMIEFSIPQSFGSSDVKLEVFNVLGQNVRTLANTRLESGVYQVSWDGRNNSGSLVSAGMYIYRLQSGDEAISNKMILLK